MEECKSLVVIALASPHLHRPLPRDSPRVDGAKPPPHFNLNSTIHNGIRSGDP
jgi:hypothetical protein